MNANQAVGSGALLAGAVRYALGAVANLQPLELMLDTPCAGWDLVSLLSHLSRSIRDIETALRTGAVPAAQQAEPSDDPDDPDDPDDDPVEVLRDAAAALIWTWFAAASPVPVPGPGPGPGPAPVSVGGLPLPRRVLANTAAVEIAVHGWDLYVARGQGRQIPASLAGTLLTIAWPLVVRPAALFAGPVAVPPCASPGDRLVAYLGRDPAARQHRGGCYWRVA